MREKIVYDVKLKRPACVLLQAAYGCGTRLAHKFPSETWLTYPTPDMRVYRVDSEEDLAQLVEVTKKAWDERDA